MYNIHLRLAQLALQQWVLIQPITKIQVSGKYSVLNMSYHY